MHLAWDVARRTFREFQDDDCLDMAAAVAYYGLLSLFPLALVLITLLTLVVEAVDATIGYWLS